MFLNTIRVIFLIVVVGGQLMAQTLTPQETLDSAMLAKKNFTRTEYALPPAVDDGTQPSGGQLLSIASKKAEKSFADRSYAEAIPNYQKLLNTDSTNESYLMKIGECYRLTNNVKGQIETYGRLIRLNKARPIHELYYAQALMQVGEGAKAKKIFEKYGADSRGKNLASSFGKQKSYTRNADAYKLNPVPFNSKYNDLCAVKFSTITVFTSTRPMSKWIVKRQGWTGNDYMNVFATSKDEKGLEKTPMLFMKGMNTKFNDGPICFDKEYSKVYYTTNNARKEERSKDGTFKLRILEGNLGDDGLQSISQPAFINQEYNYAHPSVSSDGNTLYFASDQEGGFGGMDIYRSERDGGGKWGPAINMGEKVNTAGTEMFPFVASNGSLYYSSNGKDGLGGLDIYELTFSNGKPARVYNMGEPVNSKNDDFGIYLQEDLKSGYISSNRKSGGLDDDIYELQILQEIKRGKDLLIVTKDKVTGEAMPNTRLLIDKDTVFTNEKGEYITMIDEEGVIKVKTLKEDCFELKDTISARSTTADSFVKEFLLEKNPKLFLHGFITDAKTNEPLQNVNIRITDITTGVDLDRYITTEAGDYFKFLFDSRLGDRLSYLISLEKKGYLGRSLIFNHTIDKEGEVEMNKIVNLQLGKVEVGMDLGKLIDLKPIYFDVSKSNIRPDAALELDKIVEVMNQYPNMFIELGSHTDCRSSAASNMKLSSARAKASADYIIKQGINKLRIKSKGYGETKLLNECACEGAVKSDCSEESHALNRRTEFVITRID